ncbi:tetratricopeptide repeat protein [Nitzschia inconspicua]|uniref:ER membrane protein complex subunit 2 n=1 Tax=Nitzschia inconspicua TaxID=303405 RepID=A0A9K3LHJ0_9STRA|nr:tetratricopeptide repeat protein [Nitzschia inconspicua]KAG7362138.1 tetratricopeptide repeat protein [Nitzschia inconspicua]
MIGPGEDLTSLSAKNDHLGVLRYIRAHELREPSLVIQHGTALLGPSLHKSLDDAASRTAALEQICLAALDVDDLELAQTSLKELATTHNIDAKESSRYQRLQARCLEAAGDYDGAMMMYDDMLKANPSNVVALQRKYCVLRAKGSDTVAVVEALNEYLGQQLSDVSGWYEMAQLRLSLADYKGAAYALEQVVLGSPLDADIHCQLAEVYATLGGLDNTVLARKHMAQALELNPINIRAQMGLVSVANQYLEESDAAGKKSLDEHEQLVAKELVKYGAAQVLKSYKGTSMFAAVERVMNDYTENLET